MYVLRKVNTWVLQVAFSHQTNPPKDHINTKSENIAARTYQLVWALLAHNMLIVVAMEIKTSSPIGGGRLRQLTGRRLVSECVSARLSDKHG